MVAEMLLQSGEYRAQMRERQFIGAERMHLQVVEHRFEIHRIGRRDPDVRALSSLTPKAQCRQPLCNGGLAKRLEYAIQYFLIRAQVANRSARNPTPQRTRANLSRARGRQHGDGMWITSSLRQDPSLHMVHGAFRPSLKPSFH
jgi:hypothetical protein